MESCCSAEPVISGNLPPARWRLNGATVCAITLSLVPKCPACWSVYAGLSSWLGLSIAMETRYLLPLTAVSLALAVGFLAVQARRGRGAGPFVLGAVAATLILLGKFAVDDMLVTHGGLGALLIASFWSRRRVSASGPKSVPGSPVAAMASPETVLRIAP